MATRKAREPDPPQQITELEATLNSRICVTGAELPLRINGEAVDLWQSHMVRAGDIIALGYVTSGARAYIAVAGGFNMAAQFGSTATVTRESLGGLDGKPLQQGDELACESVVDGECLRSISFIHFYMYRFFPILPEISTHVWEIRTCIWASHIHSFIEVK